MDGKYESLISDLTPLIMEELNVKQVVFENDLDEYMNFTLKPNFKVAGPVLGSKIKAFGATVSSVDAKELVASLENAESVKMNVDGEEFDITKDFIDVRIDAKEGFAVAMENNLFTILDTTLTEELVKEGLARELISKVQQLRKQHDFEMMDNINIYIDADDEVKAAVSEYKDYIMKETLAFAIEEKGGLEEYNLNGHKTGIDVERL